MTRLFHSVWLCVFALSVHALFASPVWSKDAPDACAAARAVVEGGRVTIDYDPFASTPIYASIPISIVGGTPECARKVELSVSPTTRNALRSTLLDINKDLSVEIVDRRGMNVLVDDSGVRTSQSVAVIDTGGAGVRLPANALRVRVAPGQIAPPGLFGAELSVSASVDGEVVHSAQFDVEVRVAPSVRIGASAEKLDFDQLESNERKSIDLAAYANVDFEIALVSDNAWRLRIADKDMPAFAPYTVRLNGQAAPSADEGPSVLRFARPSNTALVELMRLEFAMGDVTALPAGKYRDVITVQIRPRP